MSVTKITDLIDAEVIADAISAKLPNAIRFAGVAPIDDSLEGQPGGTISVPKYAYIGDAKDVAEGAAIDYSKLNSASVLKTIKKAAKGVELTDEVVLSGYGDPVGEGVRQIMMAVASKVDNDIVAEAKTAPLKIKCDINLDMIDTIESTFSDEDETCGVIFMSFEDVAVMRRQASDLWTRASALGDEMLVKGSFGECLGWQIVRTKKLEKGNALAVKPGAMKTFLKRGATAECERDITHKTTRFNADQHYAVALVDESKVVRVVPNS